MVLGGTQPVDIYPDLEEPLDEGGVLRNRGHVQHVLAVVLLRGRETNALVGALKFKLSAALLGNRPNQPTNRTTDEHEGHELVKSSNALLAKEMES